METITNARELPANLQFWEVRAADVAHARAAFVNRYPWMQVGVVYQYGCRYFFAVNWERRFENERR